MKHMMLIFVAAVTLSGCETLSPKTGGPVTGPSSPAPAVEGLPGTGTGVIGGRAVRAETLDTTTPEEKAKALAAPVAAGERLLGKVVVALGPPAEQGIWLKTALVTETGQGRIETAGGKSLAVELRPGTGAALLSLAAFQALGIVLTDLPEVSVFAR